MVHCESVDQLLGYEGQSAKVYFQGFAGLLEKPFKFSHRQAHPPKDPVNSLLSLGYSLLHQNVYTFVQGAGLHTHFGHLHKARVNHPAW